MTEHRPDDDRLSGAMRAALAQSVSTAVGDCPDASTLAAYVERRLGATERSACDTHVSTCARCQMVLAALIRTDDRPAPRSAGAWPSFAGWRWAVPAAAAATALGLWIMVERPAPEPVTAILEEARPRPEVESRLPETAGDRLASVEPGTRKPGEAADTPAAPATAIDQSGPAVPAAIAEPETTTKRADGSTETHPPAASAGPVAAAPAPAPAAPPPTVPPTREQVGKTTPAADAAGAAAGAREDARQESSRAAGRETPTMLNMMEPIRITTPDPQVRWRVTGSLAQRSTDGGVSWIDQPLEPGVTIFAGAAVSTRIAWLAGSNGAVFRTVDGTSWMRVSPPASDDLVTVEASSQDRATVTSRNGRPFVTTDGGRTWAGR